jgi:hypothetical protein
VTYQPPFLFLEIELNNGDLVVHQMFGGKEVYPSTAMQERYDDYYLLSVLCVKVAFFQVMLNFFLSYPPSISLMQANL